MMIPFNKPYLTGKETRYIYEAVASGKLSGNGMFTQRCQQFFEKEYFIQWRVNISGTSFCCLTDL